jgi:pyoverdine/dityrosine biosynthesis protein Dit1
MSDMTSELIYEVIHKYRKNPFGAIFDGSLIINKIRKSVRDKTPIELVLPAFHGKIANRNGPGEQLPDLGEYLGLQQIGALCEDIRAVYTHGVNLHLVHEGHFYVGTPLVLGDAELDEYRTSLLKMSARYPFIKSMNIRDFFPDSDSPEAARKTFSKYFVPSLAELTDIVADNHGLHEKMIAYRRIYSRDLKNFLFPNAGSKHIRRAAKELATQQLGIYVGFSRLLAHHFNSDTTIRLSALYKTPEERDQVAINLLPNTNHFATPAFYWVLVQKDGTHRFIKKEEAVEKNYQFVGNDGPAYFLER